MKIVYEPIGIITSPFDDLASMPIQPTSEASAPGTIEIFPPYIEGLTDLGGFSHLILLYHLHEVGSVSLTVTPFLDSTPRGVFATRAPARPNPIGLSVVELVRIDGPVLSVQNLDILNGTPLLDLKPYIPEFDHRMEVRTGWLEDVKINSKAILSDDRFA